MKSSARWLLLAGATLIVLVNAIVLAGVAWNRTGEPEATLRLSERELGLPGVWRRNRENSGLSLHLRWRVAPIATASEDYFPAEYGAYTPAYWLDSERLAALGFDTSPSAPGTTRHWRQQHAREVWLALELDGRAHAQSVALAQARLAAAEETLEAHPDDRQHREQVETARRRFERVRDEWSRLFVIDADREPGTLRARHPDRTRVAIVRGRVRPIWKPLGKGHATRGEWRGHVEAISVSAVHVPLRFRETFEALIEDAEARRSARYQVTLAYGRRHEPWIVEVHPAVHRQPDTGAP